MPELKNGWKLLGVCFFMFFLFFVYCTKKKDNSPVVAKVGSQELTIEDIWKTIPTNLKSVISENQLRDYIERWIDSKVLYQEAIRQNIKQIPEVRKQIEKMEEELLVSIFLDSHVTDNIRITDSEIESYYAVHKNDFIRPEETRRVWILVNQDRSEMNSLRRRLLQGEDFSELAGLYSVHPSSKNGGDLGYVRKNDLPVAIAYQVFSLHVDNLSSIMKIDTDYALVNVSEIRKKDETQVIDEVYDLIKETLLVQKRNDIYDQMIATLKENTKIERNYDLLRLLVSANRDSTLSESNYNLQ